MFQEDPSSSEGRKYLRIALESEPTNEQVNYLLAKSHLNDAPSHYVLNYINKSIQVDPSNLEYRWIRVQSLMAQKNMFSGVRLEMIDQAFTDVDYLIAKDSDPAKAYLIKAYLYNDLGDEWKFKKVEENENQLANFKKANSYYKEALDSFNKSVSIDTSYKDKFDPLAIDFKINEINKKITQL